MLGSTTLSHGKALYLSEVCEVLGNDWPNYLVLKALGIYWIPNDIPYYEISSSLLL